MDEDGGEPKTYVSTVRLLLRGRTRSTADPLAGATAMRNAAGFSRPTGEKVHQNPSNFINGVTGDDTTLSCKSSSGSHVTEKNTSCTSDAMELAADDAQASGEESGHRTEAEAGSPVDFLNPPEHVAVGAGEQACLRCDFRSACVPVACCWIFNRGKAVLSDPRMSVNSDDAHSSLVISEAHPDDTGSYTLIARNRSGSSEHTVSLSVIHRPDPPASHPVISQLSAESLVLSWTGPSFDGGTAVLGYIVEVRRQGADASGDWTEIAERCKNTSTQVSAGLEPYGKYRFRVRAYNAEGVGEPSQESDTVTMATTKEKKDDMRPFVKVVIDTKRELQDHYNVHEKLGMGKFGEVFRLSHKESGEVYAGKFYRVRSSKERSAARREIELMNCLHHPKLVQCLAAYEAPTDTVMVMEYIAGGELFERIVDDNFEHTEPTSAGYMRQILEGMMYVHKQDIVHLDLKPENIVCTDHTGTCIKIIDFGLASKLEEGKPLKVMHGTPEFVAPEVINYEAVGVETDMWSIGVICFILLSGESPFQGGSEAETFTLVTAAHYKFDPESFEDISDQAKDFISGLLMKDPRSRMSCIEALVHPWMASFTALNRPTKSLRKEKMRRFLAKCKWKKTGKAVLALQRMANLSNKPDSPGSSSDEPSWSQEAEEAIRSLDKQLHGEPRFQEPLRDASLHAGATACLACRLDGYPLPEVQWLQDDKPLSESSRVKMQYGEDGHCSLVVSGVEASDAGVYVCRASNQLGAASCSARLEVDT